MVPFLRTMINLTQEFPSDIDGQTLLSLAYINKVYRQSVELKDIEPPFVLLAKKVLQQTLIHEPAHSGYLRYLIHAFDVPRVEVALQAVPYAYKYGQVTLTASHGQHMPHAHLDSYRGVSMGYHQSIRRPRPNPMKLSGFVGLVSLIILIIKFLKFDFTFTEI
jgi:hypothetical protein